MSSSWHQQTMYLLRWALLVFWKVLFILFIYLFFLCIKAGLDLDEMGQIESDRHFGTPLEEQGTRGGQSDFVYSHHHSSFMSQSSSYESFKVN